MYERRLQVFVSSTYSDLREERQAAVEAILTVGHIPAGMELFAAGDQSQMEVIRQWIDDSDIFLLILGGRYGSIEPATGKSYIHLEYEHALATGKPLFCCVVEERALEERIKRQGSEAIERKHPDRLTLFRDQVLCRVVRFWSDAKDIKLAIHESLGTFSRRSELRGWVRGDHAVNTAPLVEELSRLTKENSDLRAQLVNAPMLEKFGGLQFQEMKSLLAQSVFKPAPKNLWFKRWKEVARDVFHEREVSMLHAFWSLRGDLAMGLDMHWNDALLAFALKGLLLRGLVVLRDSELGFTYTLAQEGSLFLNRMEFEMRSQTHDSTSTVGKRAKTLAKTTTGRTSRKRDSPSTKSRSR